MFTFEEIVTKYREYIPLDDLSIDKNSYTDSDDADFMMEDVYLFLKNILLKLDIYLYKNKDKYIILSNYMDYLSLDNFNSNTESLDIKYIDKLPENVFTLARYK